MVSNMIQITTDEGDIVFDPFAGSGTVMSQSAYMKRHYIGFEINKNYINTFNAYLADTFKEGRLNYEKVLTGQGQSEFEDQILNLRALKYGRLLVKVIQDELQIHSKVMVERIRQESNMSVVRYSLIGVKQDIADEVVMIAISKAPLSKFEIVPMISYLDEKTIEWEQNWFCYSITNSYSYLRDVEYSDPCVRVISPIKVDLKEKDYE